MSMLKNNQFRVGVILSYFSIALNIVAGLLYTPWIIKQIGEADYGLYTLANSLITLFVADLGLGTAISRYLSVYRAEERQDKINDFLGLIYKMYFLIDFAILIVMVVLYLLLDRIYISLTPDEIQKLKIVYLISATFAVCNYPFITFNGILTAYEKHMHLKLSEVLYRVLLIILTVFALLCGYGLFIFVTVHAIAGMLASLYKLYYVRKETVVCPRFRYRNKKLYQEIFGFSLWEVITSATQRLVFNITPSVLGVVASSASIAVFGIVSLIEGYAYTISAAISGMFMPRVSYLYVHENGSDAVMPLFLTVGRFQFALSGLIVAGFTVLGKQFIMLWLGESYIQAYYGVLLVLIPGLFYSPLQIANTALLVEKKGKLQAYVNAIMGLLNVILSVPLSALFGVNGACISIFIAYTFRVVVMHFVYWKKMKLDIPFFCRMCYMQIAKPIVITILVGYFLNHMWPFEYDWITLVGSGVVVVALYTFFLISLGLNFKERQKAWRHIYQIICWK